MDRISINNGYIEVGGVRIAEFLDDADIFAVREFKELVGDTSLTSHEKKKENKNGCATSGEEIHTSKAGMV